MFQIGRKPFAELLLEPHRGNRGVHRDAGGRDGRGGIGDHEAVGATDFLGERGATHHDQGHRDGERANHERVGLTVGRSGFRDDHARGDQLERLVLRRDVGFAVGDLVANPRRIGERDHGDATEIVAQLGGRRAQDRSGGAAAEGDDRDDGQSGEERRIRFHGSEGESG